MMSTTLQDQEIKIQVESAVLAKPPKLQRHHSMPNLDHPFREQHFSQRSSHAFDINYPDSNDSNTPSHHSQASSHSESQIPITPLNPRRKHTQISPLLSPTPPRGNAPKGTLLHAWEDFYTHKLREANQTYETQSAKARAENEALMERLRVLEETVAEFQRQHHAVVQEKNEYYTNWQNCLSNTRTPQLNLSNLPLSQSRSATGTPVSISTGPDESISSMRRTPVSGPRFLDKFRCCFTCKRT